MSGDLRVLLIDNIDSFTFNVADLLHRVAGVAPTVWRNDHDLSGGGHQVSADGSAVAPSSWWLDFDAIVVGPGPGSPQVPSDMGLSDRALSQAEVPVLGICLGHQGIAHHAGQQVGQLTEPRHGMVSLVRHDGTGLFADIPSPFPVVRYHSLAVSLDESAGAPVALTATAWAQDDGCVMAVAAPSSRRWGVQFHPESVLTEHGEQIIANFFGQAELSLPAAGSDDVVAVGDVPVAHTTEVVDPLEVTLRVRRVETSVDAWALHEALMQRPGGSDGAAVPTSVWLDSTDARGISIMADATGPLAFTCEHRVGRGACLSTGERIDGPLFDVVDTLLARVRLSGDEPALPFEFRPGLIGYLGYELKAETGGVAAHEATLPDAWLMFADRAVIVDHEAGAVFALALSEPTIQHVQEAWLDRVAELLALVSQQEGIDEHLCLPADPALIEADAAIVSAAGRHTPDEYVALIERAQTLIRAGETYEVCLTNDVTWPQPVDASQVYRSMRAISRVPHAAWLRCGDFSVLSASPERFVSLSATGVVQAEPIKGTRARHPDPAQDQLLAQELSQDAKERAENLMIVDLLRNDLHRVCRAGSVRVPEMFAVRTWSTVHQLVSTITGQVATGMGATDVLRSCFPGGSMTGAPKVATMQILDELERGPRGVYSGAIGWIGLNGAMDTSIVIRTAIVSGANSGVPLGNVTFGVGGAITALSDPSAEFDETILKARGVARALRHTVSSSTGYSGLIP